MAELFFGDDRTLGMQDPIYRNKISNTPFSDLRYQDMGGVHPPMAFPRNTGNLNYNIHQDPAEDWREDININTLSQYPQPFTPPNMLDVSGRVGEYGQIPGQGNVDMVSPEQGFQFPGIFGALINKLKREPNPALEAELASLQQNKGYLDSGQFVGRYGDGKYDMWDSITTPGGTEDIQILRGKNEPGKSAFGSETFEEAQEKKRAWIGNRLAAGKKVRSDLVRWYRNTTGTSDRFDDDRLLPPKGPVTTGRTTIGDITGGTTGGTTSTYTGPKTYDFQPQHAAPQRATRPGGFTDPGQGSYGPWKAEGGRIGYANGEFVDEDVNIQGPGFDVNENIEMSSGAGEEDILEQLVAKYIQAGFPPDQAQEMAMQELQQMVAQSGQGEGIASLV